MRRIATRPGQWAWFLLFAPAASAVVASDGLVFRGSARDLQTGKPLYRENHFVSHPGTARELRIVHYQCPNSNAVFARKEIDYSLSREMPRFTLVDAPAGYTEGLRTLPNGRAQVFQIPGPGRSERNAPLASGEAVVADAGFDEFLRRNWAALERGQTLRFAFLVPSRLHAFQFRVAKNREESVEGATVSVMRLGLAGLIGRFLPEIEASYRKSDQVLVRYKGLTNLRDAAGDNFSARIEFPQADRRPATVDVAALRAVPLVRRCN